MPTHTPTPTITTTLRVPFNEWEWLKEKAKREGRTLTMIATILFKQARLAEQAKKGMEFPHG